MLEFFHLRALKTVKPSQCVEKPICVNLNKHPSLRVSNFALAMLCVYPLFSLGLAQFDKIL